MGPHDITDDTAELLATLLEAALYGFSLLMFVGTMWTLTLQRATEQVNLKMVAIACALLVCSTVHLVIDMIRVIQGLVLYRNTFQGGPLGYFSDVSQWTFVGKNCVYAAQTLIGDAVVLYRCYVAWQSKPIMILPVLLWCAVAVTGFACPYTASRARVQEKVFGWCLSEWIMSFYASTFVTNLLTTILLALRIWSVDKKAMKHGLQNSRLRPLLHVILDAGMIYSLALLAALICFTSQTNGQNVILDMITPIISITFYMVIIRVGLTNRSMNVSPPRCSITDNGRIVHQGSRMQIQVTTLTEYKFDRQQSAPTSPNVTDESGSADSVLDIARGV